MVKKLATVAAGALALVAVAGVAFAAGTPQGPSKCSGGKVKSAGKKAAAKLGCLSKAVGKGLASTDSTCLAKAEVKFSAAIAKADGKGPDCLTTGDTAAIEAKIDALLTDIDGLVPGPTAGTPNA